MDLPPINVDEGTFAEERFQNAPIYGLLSSTCASISSIPHAEVGQFFKLYIQQFFKNNQEAYDDAEEVFKQLNDDGAAGVNNAKNMAVGFKLHKLADVFKKISKLLKDKVDVPINAVVDQPERFDTQFYNAQFRFPERPDKTQNHALDYIRLLQYVDATLNAILLGLKHPLKVNADVVYSEETIEEYSTLKKQSEDTIKEIINILKAATKIIGKYQIDPKLMSALGLDGEIQKEPAKPVIPDKLLSTKERAKQGLPALHERIYRREN